jgi:hypothetical protein
MDGGILSVGLRHVLFLETKVNQLQKAKGKRQKAKDKHESSRILPGFCLKRPQKGQTSIY